ncbi:MAG: branched-chain amino acid ABC transporter substrate-binding protein [Chloroflexi bacterium]|nr:MAG: branched-chain amino acid ABC transporter substrate-binding protein [Chloroflexota bacterium]
MKATKLGVMTFSAMLVVSACGGGTPAASGGAAGAPAACNNKVGTSSTEIHVYSSLPRQGTNTEQTNTLVEQEKKILDGVKVGKWTIKYFDLDDSSAANNGDWDGTVEQANANKAVNDPDAMAYIGTYNSGAAKLAIPILNQNCLVMVTPANTYPGLTKAVNGVTKPGEPDTYYPGGYRNYSRVVGTDDAQGAAGAEWAKSLGGTKAYVLDDTQVYGQGLAKSFALAFTNGGGTILSANGTSEGFDPKASDYNALAQKIKSSGADFIYIGSITGNNTGKLWKDLRSAMPDIKIMSGDGVYEKSWYGGVGSAGNGTYLTFGAIGPDQLTGDGKTWYEQYKTDHGGTSPAVYTAYGNAAATVVLAALNKAATNDRYQVLKNVMATSGLATVTGTVTLDKNGDVTGGGITGYQVETSWPPKFVQLFQSKGL